MQMTRWKDNGKDNGKDKDLQGILATILKTKNEEDNDDRISYRNIVTNKKFGENLSIILNSKKIIFNKIDFSYDSITPGIGAIEDRTTETKGFIILYSNGINNNYIINKNTDAQRIIRKLNGYTGRGEVEKNIFEMQNDFFIWLVKKIYNEENDFEVNDSKVIRIEAIKGFKGNTNDTLTKVSASGESVMNITSTLSFLLESGNITQINLAIGYGNHQNIDLTINDKGIISTDYLKYAGELTQETPETALCKLLLIIYLEIIPLLYNYYHQEIEDDEWNNDKTIDFLNEVAQELTDSVNKKREEMKKN